MWVVETEQIVTEKLPAEDARSDRRLQSTLYLPSAAAGRIGADVNGKPKTETLIILTDCSHPLQLRTVEGHLLARASNIMWIVGIEQLDKERPLPGHMLIQRLQHALGVESSLHIRPNV